MENNYIYLDELNEQSAPSGASVVYAPQGGKPGYRVKKADGTLGQWIPVDKSQLDSPGLKATQLRYEQERLKRDEAESRAQAERLGDAPARETGVPRGQLPPTPKPEVKQPEVKQPEVKQPEVKKPAPKPTLDPKLKADLDKFAPKINQDWAAANQRLARVELARAQQRAAGKSVFDKQFRQTKVNPIMYKQPSVEKEAYEVVLDYLLSEGHADTVEEAHYVMMQLDAEYVQSIVESGYFPTPESQRADEKKYRLSKDRLPGEHKPVKGKPPTDK